MINMDWSNWCHFVSYPRVHQMTRTSWLFGSSALFLMENNLKYNEVFPKPD